MKYDPEKHHRRSLRLRDYDYGLPGAYFVTICTRSRECLLGEIVDGEMRLNDDGRMVERWWGELANKFKTVEIDAYVVMPSHIHGIIVTVGADLRVCPDLGGHIGPPLPRMVQWFKTMTANEYIRNVRDDGSAATRTKLWQRNYYEHTIRSEAVLKSIRNYIASNPYRWRDDLENPNFAPGAND